MAERLRQHAVEALLSRIAKLLDADGHCFMTCRWLIAIGPEQAVPPRQVEAEVAVGLAGNDGVVHAMHIRRYDDPAQYPIEPDRDAHVAMVEHRGGIEQHLEGEHGDGRDSQRGHYPELDAHGQEYLDWMEARSRRHVDVQVRMMHAVEPPEGRDGMEQHVLEVDGKIQGRDGQRDAGPCRQIECMEQSPPSALGDQSKPDGGRLEDEADQNRIQDDYGDVAGPATTTPELLNTSRREHFPNRHRRKDSGKSDQADLEIVGE